MIPLDKQAHFWAGVAISSFLTLLTGSVAFGICAAIIVAALKELWDSLGYGTPDFFDFLVTTIGALLPLITLFF